MPKLNDELLTFEILAKRFEWSARKGYKTKAKWIEFCEVLLAHDFQIRLYEARQTVSKYVTVCKYGKEFRVRFSNHMPNYQREKNGDCDFFVGKTNTGIRNTFQAMKAVGEFFQEEINYEKNKTTYHQEPRGPDSYPDIPESDLGYVGGGEEAEQWPAEASGSHPLNPRCSWCQQNFPDSDRIGP